MLDRREHAIRRWHNALGRKFGPDRDLGSLVQEDAAGYSRWHDVDYLLLRLDRMQLLLRECEEASDDQRPTAKELPAMPEPRPPVRTSDDTIEFRFPTPPPLQPPFARSPPPPEPARSLIDFDQALAAVATAFAHNRTRDAYALEAAVGQALRKLVRIS